MLKSCWFLGQSWLSVKAAAPISQPPTPFSIFKGKTCNTFFQEGWIWLRETWSIDFDTVCNKIWFEKVLVASQVVSVIVQSLPILGCFCALFAPWLWHEIFRESTHSSIGVCWHLWCYFDELFKLCKNYYHWIMFTQVHSSKE